MNIENNFGNKDRVLENEQTLKQEKDIQEVFKLNPELRNTIIETLGLKSHLLNYGIELRGHIRKRLRKDGVSEEKIDQLTKAQDEVKENPELITSIVTEQDINSLIISYEDNKKEQLEHYELYKDRYKEDTDIVPEIGASISTDTSWWDNKISDLKTSIEQEKQAIKLYEKYLETIFPESKYKDITYKGVSKDFKEENKPSFYTKDIDGAKHYSSLREGTQVISAIFNFKNPLIVNADKPAPIPIITPDGKTLGTFSDKDINEKIISAGYDGLILNRKFGTQLDGWEILSFNSDSRHVLGTDTDIEKFKEFVSKNKQ